MGLEHWLLVGSIPEMACTPTFVHGNDLLLPELSPEPEEFCLLPIAKMFSEAGGNLLACSQSIAESPGFYSSLLCYALAQLTLTCHVTVVTLIRPPPS